MNSLRDKLAAATIELQQREEEVEMKEREIEELVGEHDRIVEVVEREWRGKVKEAREQVEELRDVSAFPPWCLLTRYLTHFNFFQVLAERETESKELRLNISELEANRTTYTRNSSRPSPISNRSRMRKMVRSLLIMRRFRNWGNRFIRLRRRMIGLGMSLIGLGRRKGGRGRDLRR